ncbi:hypothetical protein RvY_02788 [Ramazzottius varieornatus]|uniref:Ig-like domain-containing protein n=1 Tax=Ramazzottius varieornatus TaxID=947166 RepID=A0A1D1UKY5_RAMVA|nr:hypothetical protein RvY_02788 [Ramazzottius varieornatus]
MKFFLLFLFLVIEGSARSHLLHLPHRRDYVLQNDFRNDLDEGAALFDRKNIGNDGPKKSEREESEEQNRRRGPTAKYNQSGSYEVRLHYNESLEFYRRSRQMQPLVDDYLKCVNDSARLYERSGRITSRAMMKLVGQDVVLKCRDCHYPGKQSTVAGAKITEVQWRMIPYNEPHDINIVFDTEKFVFDNKTYDLSVSDLMVYDAARYRCVVNKEVVRVYDLQVVESDKTVKTTVDLRALIPATVCRAGEHAPAIRFWY